MALKPDRSRGGDTIRGRMAAQQPRHVIVRGQTRQDVWMVCMTDPADATADPLIVSMMMGARDAPPNLPADCTAVQGTPDGFKVFHERETDPTKRREWRLGESGEGQEPVMYHNVVDREPEPAVQRDGR